MGVEYNSYIDLLTQYTDHSASWENLVDNMRQYASHDNPDFAAINELADLIEVNVNITDRRLPGSGPFFPGLVQMLLGLKDMDDKNKKIVKRLVDKL